mmetsp:Transcript_104393/g.162791  ORF Transcript_104393/g.162791 Transcript_104393/m.162791 type:complete len:1112 (+) Transcript_104393:80-3415(+)
MEGALSGASRDLMKKAVKDKDVPWCTVCLVLFVCTCHTMVLVGNYQTAAGIGAIGTSTSGWSGVALDIGGSLQDELDEVMKNLTTKLTDAINHTLSATKSLDTVLGLAGDAADTLMGGDSSKTVSLLQAHGMGPEDALPGLVTKSLDQVLDKLLEKVIDGLDMLMEKLKPALLKAGELIQKFGDKIQNVIESFSVTLDKAQTMFDQVMAQISGGVDLTDDLLHETYGIFDVSSSGAVTAQDLKYTSSLYNIPALMGKKADELLEKYDSDGSKDLDKVEFKLLTNDEALPDLMSVVLRSFARTLTEVAGNVGASKFRGEIAEYVVDYLTLMAAKNMTKVGWISDALGNESLPIEFTADVFVNLALQLDDPNTHLELKTGDIVIAKMFELHPQWTAKAIDLISDSDYWVSEGFNPDDHGIVIERVTRWAVEAQSDSPSSFLQTMRKLSGSEDAGNQAVVDADGSVLIERSVLDIVPAVAKKVAEKNTRSHIQKKHREFSEHYDKLFASETSRYLLLHLNGGEYAADKTDASSSAAARIIKQGVPAKPETLLFAKFLSWNATDTADRFQKMCFDQTQTSSNAIDGFATQIQGMVKKIQSFIRMMTKYSTPAGIEKLETKFSAFAKNAATDIMGTIKTQIGGLINKSAPALTEGLHNAIEAAGNQLGHTIAEAISSPLGKGLTPALGGILQGLVGNETGNSIGGQIGDLLGNQIASVSGDLLGKQITGLLNNLVDQALEGIENALTKATSGLSLLQIPTANVLHGKVATSGHEDEALLKHLDTKLGNAIRHAQIVVRDAIDSAIEARKRGDITLHHLAFHRSGGHHELTDGPSSSFSQIVSTLKSLKNVMPLATKTLIFARGEVSKLAKNLDSIFETFADKGPPIFDQVSSLYSMAFTVYFFVMLPFPLILMYYAFWAGGWFGGPGGKWPDLKDNDYPQDGCPEGMWAKCMCCCSACKSCWITYHDTHLCFWSCCIFLQVVTLVLFLVSLVFCILAAVQMFISSGCAQVYMLGDGSVCGNTLLNLRMFLDTFLFGIKESAMAGACDDRSLLTCDMIGSKMQSAGMLTVAGSMVAAGASFQMIIESSTLHSRAVVRRMIDDALSRRPDAKDTKDDQ